MSRPEVRVDQLTGMRTVLAPGRASRPDDFAAPEVAPPQAAETCPFCEGREDRTPPEVWARRAGGGGPDTPGWAVRTVPNKFPVVAGEEDAGAGVDLPDGLGGSARGGDPDMFASLPATGSHEVIVHGPEHVTSLTMLDDAAFAGSVEGWRERMRAHSGAACRHLIVNEGQEAGASLEHTHAQLYALPFVPVALARERERLGAHATRTMGACLLCDIGAEEVRRGERLVAIDDEAMLIAPWASRSPFELRVVPRRHRERFEDEDGVGTEMLRRALDVLSRRFGAPPQLNLWVRTAPAGSEHFHWHVDIVPRLTVRAGFELGTGVEINVYPPERAAADLRDVDGG